MLAEAEVSEEMHTLEIRLAELLDLKTVSDEAYRFAVFPPPLCISYITINISKYLMDSNSSITISSSEYLIITTNKEVCVLESNFY